MSQEQRAEPTPHRDTGDQARIGRFEPEWFRRLREARERDRRRAERPDEAGDR
jgi:hypothetical protein